MFKRYKLQNRHLSAYNPKDVGSHYGDKVHAHGPTIRKHWLIHYVFKGEVTLKKEDNTYTVKKGQCFIIRPDEIAYYKTSENWYYVWMGFAGSAIPSCIKTNDVLDAAFLEEIFSDIENNLERYNGKYGENGVREAYLSGKISEAMALLEINYDKPKESAATGEMRKVKNYIDIRIASDLKISDIADEFHIDRAHLSRKFKDTFGMSPQNYIVNARLAEAAKLMREHGLSPTDASMAVGYSDIYLFSKMFKKKYGVPPREYKKRT